VLNLILNQLQSLPKEYKILDGLWEVLTEKQKPRVKSNLIDSLISMLMLQTSWLK
jgi:hypothetical protein